MILVLSEAMRSRLTGDDAAFAGAVSDDSGRVDTEQRLIEAVVANATLAISQLAKGAGNFSRDVEMETAGHFSTTKQGEGVDTGSEAG
jgi:hypothetical protein